MKHDTILTLDALLADPVTLAVMRSDGVSLAETTRICRNAWHALAVRSAGRPETGQDWRVACH